MQRGIALNGENVARNHETEWRAVFASLESPNLTFFAAPQPGAGSGSVELRALNRPSRRVALQGKRAAAAPCCLRVRRSRPVAVVGPGRRIPKVKCNGILTIKRNGKAGFAGLNARFTPSRENAYDKVQRDTGPLPYERQDWRLLDHPEFGEVLDEYAIALV